MSLCSKVNELIDNYLQRIRQAVTIDRDKDKPLRYNVWETTSEQVRKIFTEGIGVLPEENNNTGQHVLDKVKNALERISESSKSVKEFQKDIINDDNNIALSIALHEMMESVKGESDKATNLSIGISEITDGGILPSLPLSRIAASIGRKIVFQKGYRFKTENPGESTPVDVEILYYKQGLDALEQLEAKGYVKIHESLDTIKDYMNADEIAKKFPKINIVTNKFLSVTLVEDTLGVDKPGSLEAKYFLNRTESDLSDTKLGVITDMLRVVRDITQPATVIMVDTSATKTVEELAEFDDPSIAVDPVVEQVRKKSYDTPLFVHETIHSFIDLLNKEHLDSGNSGSKIIKEIFGDKQTLLNGLFGIKRSDDFSIDKKESIVGQNLSKTTPLDDLVENYGVLSLKGARSALHLAMKIGRNARLYYVNSVLNPHGSKQSRYMLTAKKQSIKLDSDGFKRVVYSLSQALKDKGLTYKDFTTTTGSKLDKAVELLTKFESQTQGDKADLQHSLATLSRMADIFPGIDYVTLLTSLKAVKDIRSPDNEGNTNTEYASSSDATASGGTLTLLQALGTNPNVVKLLERLGLLLDENGNDVSNSNEDFDLYGIMSEAITDFVEGKEIDGLIGQDTSTKADGIRALLQDTVNMLFNEGNDTRELSKDPTMTFIYGQGKKGAISSMANSLANRIIDNLDDKNTREYLVKLFNNTKYRSISSAELKNTKGLHRDIIEQLTQKGKNIPGQLWDLMDIRINKELLKEYKTRSSKVYDFVSKLNVNNPFKVLPASAVLAGIEPTLENIKKYGMPLTKIFEASNKVPGSEDTVLTRIQKPTKTVAEVSTIHSVDAAQLYTSADKVLNTSGMVFVHDQVIGTVEDVIAMEEQFKDVTVDITTNYDIHQSIMQAVAAYDPTIAESQDYKDMVTSIQVDVDAKKKLIKERFNPNTSALIGDGDKHLRFADPESKSDKTVSDLEASVENAIEPTTPTENEIESESKPESKTKEEPQTPKPQVEKEQVPKTEQETAEEVSEEKQKEDEVEIIIKGFKDSFTPETGSKTEKEKGSVSYLNFAVASMLNSKLESNGKKVAGRIHKKMKEVFPIYTDASNKLAGIYNGSEDLQQLIHTITGNGTNKTKKADLLANMAKVMSNQTAVVNDQIGKFNKLLKPLSEQEKTTIGRFVTEMPLHDYFILAEGIVTEEEIASEVTRLEKLVRKQPNALRDVNDLISWNVEGKKSTKGRIYNLETSYPITGSSDFGINVRKLLALKSIQTIGSKEFVKFLENTDLVNLIKDNSVANRVSLLQNEGVSKLPDSMISDYYKEPFAIEAIELHELKRYENGENTGWKILKKPTDSELGIVWKPIIDSSNTMGAYTDIKLRSGDINIKGNKVNYPGVIETSEGSKLRLTKEQKIELGLVEDFSHALVKSAAHSMAVQDSQIIRDELLKLDTRMILGKDTSMLSDIIKSSNIDNPWFIKLEDGVSLLDMPADIRAKYKPVGSRASNVKNFDKQVDLVRKDISHWLLGGSATSLFQNPKMKWATRIVKDLVSGAKIGMVVMNPAKIVQDNISNLSYLGVMGVSPLFIAKNYKNITKDFQEYSDLERQIIQLKVQQTAKPDSTKIKKQIKTLQDRVKRNSLGDLSDKGFINSLGSDLVARNADTLSGLQADMHTALKYLLINKEGKKNFVSHFILQLQNLGFKGEDFLTYIGRLANKTGESGGGVQSELDQVTERLKEIRSEEDIVNYVSQYTNSPGSEAVRIGASITDLTDVLAKETLYRHLTENDGLSPESARIKVLDSFPDYKENMPLAVKQLSDFGIIMFPSFWLRIQKVIYRMVRDKPINLATELMLEEAFNSDVNTILDANILNKSNSFGGLLHTPLEPIGTGSVIPEHIFNF